MNIQIEDYFGNDVVKLNYCLKDKVISDSIVTVIGVISSDCGYGVADIDSDEDDIQYIRLQQGNVDNTEEEEKKDLIELINKLNTKFL
jgi:hypothetical protein